MQYTRANGTTYYWTGKEYELCPNGEKRPVIVNGDNVMEDGRRQRKIQKEVDRLCQEGMDREKAFQLVRENLRKEFQNQTSKKLSIVTG